MQLEPFIEIYSLWYNSAFGSDLSLDRFLQSAGSYWTTERWSNQSWVIKFLNVGHATYLETSL